VEANISSTCLSCAAGKSSATGASSSTDCVNCLAGKYSLGGAGCVDCGAG
jgi:hypothetical protein